MLCDLGPANGLDLAQTLTCGQCFRWHSDPARPGVWKGTAGDRQAAVFPGTDGHLYAECAGSNSAADFWRAYFALDVDYAALQRRFSAGSKRLAACVAAGPGIRVLRQPFFETLCTFIISQNNNIPRITGIVERLCALCGEPLPGGGYAFPTAQALAAQTPESLAPLRAGWRAAYLVDAARRVAGGQISEQILRTLPPDEARALLMTVRGVGPKVADCTLLYGLGVWTACPMDVWMKRAMKTLFPRGMPRCAKGYEGVAQQYIFAYARANLLRGETGGPSRTA